MLHALLIIAGLIALQGVALYAMGRPPICPCGFVALWHGAVPGPQNSQHLADWYTPSHVVHGFLFYLATHLLWPSAPLATRLALAVAAEVGWELLENSPMVIERYRTATMAADYHGDSIVNSLADTLAMMAGFVLAWRLPVAATVTLAVIAEIVAAAAIRDNLTLNILMLIYPFDFILRWQAGLPAS